jgi:toxin ParE1/3/4
MSRQRYEVLILTAIEDLATNPGRPNVQLLEGRIHYHLRHSRDRVPTPPGKVQRPRHIVIARLDGDVLHVLAFAYDAMEASTIRRRAEEGEAER